MADGNRAEKTFRRLYEGHQKMVYAYFMSCFHDSFTAEELSQETFEKVWKYLRENPWFIPVQPRPWLFSIVANVKNDWLRKKQRSLPYGGPLEEYVEVIAEDRPSAYGNPEDCLEAIPIQQAFQMMNEAERQLLSCKGQGLTSVQMELILAVPASTLRSRMSTAKKKFRKALKECGAEWE